MSAKDWYPLGAYNDPSAPYNQPENEERDFKVIVAQTLVKHDVVCSSDYIIQDYGVDECGHADYEMDTSEIDFRLEWLDQKYDIPFLIGELQKYIVEELEGLKSTNELTREKRNRRVRLQNILKACDGWELDETVVDME